MILRDSVTILFLNSFSVVLASTNDAYWNILLHWWLKMMTFLIYYSFYIWLLSSFVKKCTLHCNQRESLHVVLACPCQHFLISDTTRWPKHIFHFLRLILRIGQLFKEPEFHLIPLLYLSHLMSLLPFI